MFKSLITRVLIIAAVVTVVAVPLVPGVVLAAGADDVLSGVNVTGNQGGPSVEEVIANVINLLSWIVGIIAVIMVIIGGLKYIMSSGDSSNVSSAKNTILYAIIGLVVVAIAQVIVRFVLNNVVKA